MKASIVDKDTGLTLASDFYPKEEAAIKAVRPGWAEQNPDDWWMYLKEAIKGAIAKAGIKGTEIDAIGISYQMHGLVLVDRKMQVLRPSVIWCDSRAVPYGDRAFKSIGEKQCLAHLLNSPGNFTASKLAWVKEYEPQIFGQVHKFMLPGDFIAMRMTGDIVTTVSGLSEGIFWDFRNNSVSEDLMSYFGFSKELVPDIRPTFGVQGELLGSVASELGLKKGTPVTYRAGDQPNNALSLNVLNPGEIAATGGTSGVVYGVNGKVNYDTLSRVNTFAHVNHSADRTRLGVLLCINGVGILNSWVKRNVAPEGISYPALNELAATVPIGSEGLSILPFGNGAERMLQNKQVDCSIHGLNFNIHNKAHIARAAQEGTMEMLPKGEFHNGHNVIAFIGSYDEATHTFTKENVQLMDGGIDFYATQTTLAPDGRRIMTAWLQTWSDTEDKPKGCKWFGQTICPRELHIKDGRIVQAPVRELDAVHGKRTFHENVTVQSETSLEGIKGRVADLTVTVQPGEYRSFTLKLAADADHHTSLTYDPYTSELTLDRSYAGSRADIVHRRSCKVRSQNGALKLRILLDKNSIEVFANDGEQTMTAWIYTPQSADGITFTADGKATVTVEQFELNL